MNRWILICNNNYFNIKKAFETENTITWPQKEEVFEGDIVYFYVTNPYRAILYKCRVEAVGLYQMDESTKECVIHALFYENKQLYMRLKLLEAYAEDFLTDEKLKEFGIHNLQSVRKIPEELSQYLVKKSNQTKMKSKIIIIRIQIIILTVTMLMVTIIAYLIVSSGKREVLSNLHNIRRINNIDLSQKEQSEEENNLKKKEKIVLATNAYFPPFEYYEGEKITGIDIEIAEAIAEKLDCELVIQNMDFEEIIQSVNMGETDIGLSGMTETLERSEYVDYTDTYVTNTQSIMVKKNSEINSRDDLYNKIIGVKSNSSGDIYGTVEYGEENVIRYDYGIDTVLALMEESIDAVIIDKQSAEEYKNMYVNLKILNEPYIEESYVAYIAKDNEEFLELVNSIIFELKKDGSIQAIIDKYV